MSLQPGPQWKGFQYLLVGWVRGVLLGPEEALSETASFQWAKLYIDSFSGLRHHQEIGTIIPVPVFFLGFDPKQRWGCVIETQPGEDVCVCAHIHTCAPMIWYQYKRNLAISLSLPTFLPFSHHPVILPLHPPEVWVLPTLEKAHLSVPREFIVSILHMYCQGGFWKPFLGLSSEPIGSNHCS